MVYVDLALGYHIGCHLGQETYLTLRPSTAFLLRRDRFAQYVQSLFGQSYNKSNDMDHLKLDIYAT